MKQNLYLLLLLLSFSFKLFAQTTIPLTLTSPATINTCSLNSFQGSFLGQGQVQHFKIGTSILYNGNTHEACGLLRGSQVVVDSIRKSNDTLISPYNIVSDSGYWSGTIPIIPTSDTIIVFFHVDVDCAIIPTNVGVNSMQLVQEWVDSVSTFSLNGTGANTDTSTAIKYPQLVNLSPTSYQAAYNDTLNLNFIFLNAGNAPANMGFHFEPDASVLCGTADTIDCSYQIGKLGVVHPFFPANDLFTTLSIGDTLFITQRVIPGTCLSVCSDSAKLRWFCAGAQSSGSQLCDSCVGSSDLMYVIQNAPSPDLVITRVLPSLDSLANNDSSCINDLSAVREWKYKITTNGPGKLDSARIHFTSTDPLAMNILSLIPFSTVQIDTFCNDCYVDTMYQLNPNALCNTAIPDPLGFIDFIPHNFGGNDSILFTFKTYRCVEELDTLFTMPKYFNTWKFEGSYARGICGDSVSPVFLPTAFPVFNIVNHIGGYVQPFTFYAPFITDLSAVNEKAMPIDSLWGDSAVFSVEWNGYMYETINRSLFGCPNDNTISCTPHGYLKAVISTQPGLGVGTHDLQLRYTDSLGNAVFIAPDYYYTNFTDTACIGGFLTCYFNLENAGVNKALQNGYFDFPLKSCCGAQNGGVPYSVKFYFLLNPTGDCTGLSFTVSGDTLPPTCLSDSCEWLPLSKIEDDIVVHCPGCITPGIVISNYNIRRTSYGLQDTNNDGLADTPATPIDENSLWFNDHRSQLSSHYASLGDRLEDRLLAYFSSGVIGDGYNYPQMTANGAILKHLQLSRLIPASHDTMQLHIDTLTIYIDTPDNTGLNSCLECSEYGLSPAQYSTQRKLIISGPAIYNYVDTSITDYYLINLTSWDSLGTIVGNLHNSTQTVYSSSVHPLAGFFEQQRYRIKTSYSVCGNFKQDEDDLVTDLEDVRKESEIENKMWLTGYLKPANAFSIYFAQPANLTLLQNDGWAIPPDTSGTPIDSAFAGHYIFVCEDFGGKLYFFSQDVRNLSSLKEKKQDCIKQINILTDARMGGNLLNVYPYEYHPSVLQPENYQVEVPSLYYIVSASARNTVNYNGTSLSSTPWIPLHLTDTIGQVQIPDSLFHRISCLLDTSQTDTSWFYYGSRITIREINLDIQPLVCTDSLTIYETDTLVVIHANGNHTQCGAVNTCASQYADTILTLPYGQQAFTTHPNDSITYVPNLNVTSQRICMEFTLSNLAVSGEQITYVPNYFLVVPDSNQIPYLSNWTLTTAGGLSIPMADSVFQLDSIVDVGEITTYRLCADFIACPADSLDSLSLKLGWNCNNFPTKQQADSSCFIRFIQYHLKYEDAALIEYRIVATSVTIPYTICKPFKYTKCFKVASAGDVQPLSFVVDPPAPWLHILSVQAGRDSCPGDTSHILLQVSPGTYTYNITDSTLPSLGYADSVLHTNECLCGTVTFQSECDTLGGFLPNIRLVGEKYCGDSLYIDVTTNYLAQWDGTSQCHDCFSITKTLLDSLVAVGDTITYEISVTSNNGVPMSVGLSDITPPGFQVTNALPNFATVPAQGDTAFQMQGYFMFTGSCPQMQNIAYLAYADFDSLNHVTSNVDSISDTACVDVLHGCITDSTLVFPDGTISDSLEASYDHLSIYMAGTFTMNTSISFNYCKVFMAPGSVIILNNTHQLNLYYTSMMACDSMWQGIRITGRGTVNLEDSSLIADAQEAIHTGGGGNVKINNSSLLNNNTGVLVPDQYPSLFSGSLYLNGANFGMTTAFKPDYAHQPTHGNKPYAGMLLHDVAASLGDDHLRKNLFFNMNNGIRAYRSNLKVYNSNFWDIQRVSYYNNGTNQNGSAISIVGDNESEQAAPSSLNLWPNPDGSPNVSRSACGVYAAITTTEIYGCLFDTLDYGIDEQFLDIGLASYLQYNTIRAKKYGLRLMENNGSDYISVESNSVTMLNQEKSAVGIYIGESNAHHTNTYNVNGNGVFIYNATAGIQTAGVSNATLTYNTVELRTPTTYTAPSTTGIDIGGGELNYISCNHVEGHTVDSVPRYGYRISQSTGNTIQCNVSDSTSNSFRFEGAACMGTKFKGNYIGNAYCGLYLNSDAIIGQQPDSSIPPYNGNVWLDTARYTSGFGAVNLNAASFLTLQASLFTTNTYTLAHNPKIPGNTSPPPFNVNDDQWFLRQYSGGAFDCNHSYVCLAALQDSGDWRDDQLRMRVVRDSNVSSLFIPESKQIASQLIYADFKSDSNSLGVSAYSDFLDEKENLSEGVIYKLDSVGAVINTMQVVRNDSLSVLIDQLKILTDSILIIDSIVNLSNDTTLISQKEDLLIQISEIKAAISQIQEINSLDISTKQSEKEQLNNQLFPQQVPDANYKEVENISLLFKQNGVSAISENYESLIQIAVQCPSAGGSAVFKARSLVLLVNDSTVYDDANACAQLGILRMANHPSSGTRKKSFIISPNPANTEVNLYLDQQSLENYTLSLINNMGAIVLQKEFKRVLNTMVIPILNYPQGVYTIQLKKSNGEIMSEKLVIVR